MEDRKNRLQSLAELFKIFGDYSRIRIIDLLVDNEYCVKDISEKLEMSQSAVSHQLKILRENKLVKIRRVGKKIFYSLDDEHVEGIFNQGMEHIEHR